jgi:chromosome segregation ATPase
MHWGQAAHEAEVASLRAAIHAAEEQCRNAASKHEQETEEKDGVIADLKEEVAQLQARAAALEASAGAATKAICRIKRMESGT